MAVLIDTNVIIDFLMTRERFYKASAEIIKMCAEGKFAKSAGAEYIITRNVDDFKNSDIAAILPEDLLKLVSCSCLDDAPKVE